MKRFSLFRKKAGTRIFSVLAVLAVLAAPPLAAWAGEVDPFFHGTIKIKGYPVRLDPKKTMAKAISDALFFDAPLIAPREMAPMEEKFRELHGLFDEKAVQKRAKTQTSDPATWPMLPAWFVPKTCFEPADIRLELNIPAFSLRAWKIGKTGETFLFDWPVVVGNPYGGDFYMPTPVGRFWLFQVTHYPMWIDPENPEDRTAANLPGPSCALGVWKIDVVDGVYLHGTPPGLQRLLKKPRRAFSHGCIRNINDNIAALSYWFLMRTMGKKKARAEFSRKNRRTRIFSVKDPMPLTIRYDLMETAPGQDEPALRLYRDVYSRNSRRFLAFFDEKDRRRVLRRSGPFFSQTPAAPFITEISTDSAVETLLEAGVPVFRIDTAALGRLCRTPRKKTVSIAPDDYFIRYALIDPILDMIQRVD